MSRVFVASVSALLVTAVLAGCSSPPVLAPEAAPTFVLAWGGFGPSPGMFTTATDVAADGAGNVYVTDSGSNRVAKFTSGGVFVKSWGGYGSANGSLQFPTGITTDAAGNVYVVDSANFRIQKFDANGNFLAKWGGWGAGNGLFKHPRGIALDPQGNVYVTDKYGVQKFDPSGTYLSTFGTWMLYPRGITVDAGGNVYVADKWNDHVRKFDSAGNYTAHWGGLGSGDGQFTNPYGIDVDADGYVYVTDDRDRVQKFTGTGQFLASWGSLGDEDGEFNEPFGLDVDATGNVYVVDGNNDRVQKFGVPIPQTISVHVRLNGMPWSGPVAYALAGPLTVPGASAPSTTPAVPPGVYALNYISGGPTHATFAGVSTGPQTLAIGEALTFTLEFTGTTDIVVDATFNGAPWSGPLTYDLHGWWWSSFSGGSSSYAGVSAPQTFTDVAVGANVITAPYPVDEVTGNAAIYSVQYLSGGPVGAVLTSVTPGTQQILFQNTTRSFTLHFWDGGLAPNTILVDATLDGTPWSGPLAFEAQGVLASTPFTMSPVYVGPAVPQVLHVQAGTETFPDPLGGSTALGAIYGVHSLSGGPPGATLTAVTPGNAQLVPAGGTKTYTFEFRSTPLRTGDVEVHATLDGVPWTGTLGFALAGPQAVTGVTVPHPATGVPLGAYTASLTSGGPPGATLATITPSATQTVTGGTVTTYTFEFRTAKADAGQVAVKATLDGAPWTGPVAYTLSGPVAISGASVPQTSANVPPGNFSIAYGSGGPPGASFVSVAPSVSQTVMSGATRTFTLEFKTDEQAVETGTILVEATLAGAGGPVAWSGPVNFTVTGPHPVGGSSAPTSATVPVGTYTLVHHSGGPPGATFSSVAPSTTQTLTAGGTTTFTLRFT